MEEQTETTAVTGRENEDLNFPNGKEQGANEGNSQKTWAEVVNELRPRSRWNSENETTPTQTEIRSEESLPVAKQETEKRTQGRKGDEDDKS